MKATKYLSLAALALMGTLASCQSDDEAAVSFARPANAVGINVTVGAMQTTRSNPASTDPDEARYFNLGDQVCVSTDGQDPVLFECQNKDDQTWAEAEAGKFLLWKQSEMTFKAFYPATEGTSMTAFTLPADQSTTEKIAQADYMTRQQTCNNVSGTDINLQLERKMARVIVRIADFNDQYFDDQKTVSNVRIYSESSGIADGNPTGSSTEIQPYAQGNGGAGTSYTALVVPGSGDSGARFIQLSDGEGNTLEVKGIPELEAGNSYTFNLTVGKNTIKVQSVTVENWATGTTLTGGQAVEQAEAVKPEGAIDGKFTINANGDQVYFSQGNLQYQASTNTWQFAEHQYDWVANDNNAISQTNSGWIDLFGWGSSGYNHGANCYQPWSTSEEFRDYYAYGAYTNNLYDGDGDAKGKADWGYNAISNGGNTEGQWRTLTRAEWDYIFTQRNISIRWAKGNVEGINGVIILPDNWTESTYPLNNPNGGMYHNNTITKENWANTLEANGAVFLPAAGYRSGTTTQAVGSSGYYWSSSYEGTDYAYYGVSFDYPDLYVYNTSAHHYKGSSVRLVHSCQ